MTLSRLTRSIRWCLWLCLCIFSTHSVATDHAPPTLVGTVISVSAPQGFLQLPQARVQLGQKMVTATVTLSQGRARPGDRVQLAATPQPDGETVYTLGDFERRPVLLGLAGVFLLVAFAVGRGKGLRAVLGMALSMLVVLLLILPAIVAGANPVVVALFGSVGILTLTVFFVHGLNWTSAAALLGTVAATALTVALASLSAVLAHLSGVNTEEALYLQDLNLRLNLQALLLAGMTIGALGAIVDATVPQASVVRELAFHGPEQPWSVLYHRAMRVGLDHIGSLINTLVLAYVGTSLPVLVLLTVGGAPWAETVNAEYLASVVVQTLVGSIGLVLAVPVTTLIAALAFQGRRLPAPAPDELHRH